MMHFDRSDRLYRGQLALGALRDMLVWASPGATVSSENLGALVDLIEQDIASATTDAPPVAMND